MLLKKKKSLSRGQKQREKAYIPLSDGEVEKKEMSLNLPSNKG